MSCANRALARFDQLQMAAAKNDYLAIIKTIQSKPKLYDKQSRFLYAMDIGLLFHYAALLDSSNRYLEEAAGIYDELFTKSVTNEAASLLINDNVRPYRSKPYELILLHQIKMFNYMGSGDFNAALVESKRAQLLIDEWERRDAKEKKYTSDGLFHLTSALVYSKIGEIDNASISLFKSVGAYQKGVVALPDQVKDLAYYTFQANGREADNQTLGLKPTRPQDSVSAIVPDESEVILIGYAGRGPILDENVWWGTWVKDGLLVMHYRTADGKEETVTMPAPALPQEELDKAKKGEETESGTTLHLKFAMPAQKRFQSRSAYFSVTSPSLDTTIRSFTGNDYDLLCGKYLDDTRATTLARTVIRVALRTISAEKTKDKLKTGNTITNLLINFGTDILADQLEKADTRSCYLIPKTVHIARIPLKAGTHTISVAVHNDSGAVIDSKKFENIRVLKGTRKLLFYPSLF